MLTHLSKTTHKNITAELTIVKPAFPSLESGVDTMLGFLPFYHIYGQPFAMILFVEGTNDNLTGAVMLLHLPFTTGAPVVIMSRFDPVQFCANIEKYKITIALIVPPVLVVLSRHPGKIHLYPPPPSR